MERTLVEYVKAPGKVSPGFDGVWGNSAYFRASGAWVTRLEQRHLWVTQFGGTHQRVPFKTVGRTAGRSLRAMRRALVGAKIPANV